jgi:hypothetical protein
MKFQLQFIVLTMLLLVPQISGATSVQADLQRLGQGNAYYLGFIKVYQATLFGDPTDNAETLLSDDTSKCLHLEYAVDVTKQQFIEVAETVLERQFSAQRLEQVRKGIEELHAGYLDVNGGDSYTLCYCSETGVTTLARNDNQALSIDLPGFAEVYFSIWLGQERPLNDRLRNDLLAGLADK